MVSLKQAFKELFGSPGIHTWLTILSLAVLAITLVRVYDVTPIVSFLITLASGLAAIVVYLTDVQYEK